MREVAPTGWGARRVLAAVGVGAGLILLLAAPGPSQLGAVGGGTAAPVPTPETSAARAAGLTGLSRAMPALPTAEVLSEGYGVTLLDSIQGRAAADEIARADPSNPPPPAGEEYVLVRLRVRNTGGSGAITVAPTNFGLTATAGRLYPAAPVIGPQPELRGDVVPGGELEGWVALSVAEGETDRRLVLLPGIGVDPETYRYLALDDWSVPPRGTTPVAEPVAGSPPNDRGLEAEAPAGVGAAVVTERLAIQIVEALRGEAAAELLRGANEDNPPPLPENEQVVVRVRVTAVGAVDEPISVSPLDFSLVGRNNVRYSQTGLVSPPPELDVRLFPGGSAQGNLAFEVSRADQGLSLVYQPIAFPGTAPRYLAAVPIDAATPPAAAA